MQRQHSEKQSIFAFGAKFFASVSAAFYFCFTCLFKGSDRVALA